MYTIKHQDIDREGNATPVVTDFEREEETIAIEDAKELCCQGRWVIVFGPSGRIVWQDRD